MQRTYTDGVADFLTGEMKKREQETRVKEAVQHTPSKEEKKRLAKQMRQLISTINAVEVLSHTDAGDLSDWLSSIRRDLQKSVDALEAIK